LVIAPEKNEVLIAKSSRMLEDFRRRRVSPAITAEVENLPIRPHRDTIVTAIEGNQVVIISAETGSGKTTQVPQYILDWFIQQNRGAQCNILVTQPRRISAISVAQRIAEERGEQLGVTVGYNIRFEALMPKPNGCVVFCTTGILLRMLQSDPDLNNISHVLLDEVHERDINNDFLMIVLRDLLRRRQGLKVVLMSATMNLDLFRTYFDNCPVIQVPGKLYDVTSLFLEDIQDLFADNNIQPLPMLSRRAADFDDDETSYSSQAGMPNYHSVEDVPLELIECLLYYICVRCLEGGILVFLPGWEHIRDLNELLERDRFRVGYRDSNRYRIHLLHSSVPTLYQHEIFRPVPREARRIILTTNIAETSVTIPDIFYVVDTARLKELSYLPSRRVSSLNVTWVSKSSSAQRKGRAGRVQNGVYFCLISRSFFSDVLSDHQVEEMKRLDLQELCLTVKSLGIPSIRGFLNKALQPPYPSYVDSAVERLKQLQALDAAEDLTPLGRHLASLPVDPGLGKMLFLGVIFKCLDPVLTIVAASNTKDPFVSPPDRRAQGRESKITLSMGTNSDHLAIVNAYNKWVLALGAPNPAGFCDRHYLSHANLQMIMKTKQQLFTILVQTGFVDHGLQSQPEPFGGKALNVNRDNFALLKAILASGFYPNYAERGKKRVYRTKEDKVTVIHPSSVNYKGPESSSPWLVYEEKVRTTRTFLRNTSQVPPTAIVLFGGILDPNLGGPRTLVMDDWMIFSAPGRDATLFNSLRDYLDIYLKKCYANPQRILDTNTSEVETRLFNMITELVTEGS